MPTTRSSKRPSEAFTSLPEPPKRQRKRKNLLPRRVPSLSPELDHGWKVSKSDIPQLPLPVPSLEASNYVTASTLTQETPNYTNASTQTDEKLYVLTQKELDALIEKAVEDRIASNKRSRDDDDEGNDSASKRIHLTPTPKSSYGFLFNKPPNTAPAKSLVASTSTPTRVIRGPISNRLGTPANRRRMTPLSKSAHKKSTSRQTPAILKPVEIPNLHTHSSRFDNQQQDEDQSEVLNSHNSVEPQPSRRGIFGSLRGLAQTGLEFAMNLSPRRNRSPSVPPTPTPAGDPTNQNEPSTHDDENEKDVHQEPQAQSTEQSEPASDNQIYTPQRVPRQQIPFTDHPRPASIYDHLHFIKPGSEEERRIAAGEWIDPPEAEPLDELERLKRRNPKMSEGQIKTLLARRKRTSWIMAPKVTETPKVAPLFGPDSHYARGTVDPRFLSEKSYRMYAKYPLIGESPVGSKRKHSAMTTDATKSHKERQAYVEDAEDEEETAGPLMDEELEAPETPTAKKQKTLDPVTPRSALKKQGVFGDTNGKSARSVNFNINPVSGSRGLRAHYGPAGQYKGSTFADLSSPPSSEKSTLSTMDDAQALSPTTRKNTLRNMTAAARIEAMLALEKNLGANIPEIDFTLRDPNYPDWRPSPQNPRPGTFRVPYIDEDDMEEDETSASPTPTVPPQPSTPRMSHAELPAPTPQTNGTSFNESSIQFESTELALEKARSKAQKYKPKDSSRLSEVSHSVDLSPSQEKATVPNPPEITAPAVQAAEGIPQSWSERKPYVEAPLDNTKRGEDGMTDYEREHQYDEWAANLPWDEPQTYEEAGTGTKEIHDLIRKNWTEEDSRRSEEFWQKEFDAIDLLQKKAKAKGQVLQFLTGMEEAYEAMEEVH